VGKHGAKRLPGIYRHGEKYIIKMDLKETGLDGLDRIGVAQNRDMWRALLNAVMKSRIPCNAGNFLSS
jgi:hypothetical protein